MTCELFLFIHNEMKYLHLLRRVCEGIANQTIPVTTTVIFDSTTPAIELELVKSFGFDSFRCIPNAILNNLPLVHQFAYSLAKEQYVGFVQSDDPPFINRCERQITALREHPIAALACAGFYTITNENLASATPGQFYETEPCGINVGYPSGWMFNRKQYPEMHMPQEFSFPDAWDWDPWFLLSLARSHTIFLQREKLFTYHLQQNNKGSTISQQMKDRRFQELCDFYHHHQDEIHPHLLQER